MLPKLKSRVFLVALTLTATGCARLSEAGFDRPKLAADVAAGSTIRLSDYTSFAWDRVHVFAPYTPDNVIAEETRTGVAFPHRDSEGHCLLVFRFQGNPIVTFEVERKSADFAEVFRQGGYTREEAVFAVETRGSDGKKYLKKKTRRWPETPAPPAGSP